MRPRSDKIPEVPRPHVLPEQRDNTDELTEGRQGKEGMIFFCTMLLSEMAQRPRLERRLLYL